ncbi:HK97 family phage prohead protease [Methylobacterium sp. PvR107]|uniref:HK97 family phage prohead protease n=1 Tax=Methylobacterium sp. PvR107 TaxID=2806597 RepID=UPI001AEB77CC|nr:HK97 family phage prohead protease [Methylobacterium sp. PvR107]MBP1179983.1 HK97 family phage prohead protease [Methylobacterium sp. PvR107]
MASKRVSIDEYLGSRGYGGVERKNFARDDGLVLKALPAAMVEKAKFDKEAGTIRFVMSAEIEDRDRDIVVQAGLDTAQFEKNPVAPWGHQARDMPVGQWSDITKTLTGRPKRTEGTLKLTKGEPQADRLALHLEAGSIRACSIGFMPKTIERREVPDDADYYYPGYMIHEAELYECSPVSIPANPAALAKAAAEGDALSREMIERVLDCWDLKDGLIIPRKAFEDAYDVGTKDRTMVLFQGKSFEVKQGDDGAPVLAPVEPSAGEKLVSGIETDEGLLSRLAKALGLKSKTGEADPAPSEGGKKPAPEPTPEQKLREQFAKDIPALEARHALLEAASREAALDEEMALHGAA